MLLALPAILYGMHNAWSISYLLSYELICIWYTAIDWMLMLFGVCWQAVFAV